MRLAEAILLGRSLIQNPAPKDVRTCAIGMVFAAHGIRTTGQGTSLICWVYPWLEQRIVFCPFGCGKLQGASVVWHLFDSHVYSNYADLRMTLEQMADFIDSVDPTPREQPSEQPERNQPERLKDPEDVCTYGSHIE